MRNSRTSRLTPILAAVASASAALLLLIQFTRSWAFQPQPGKYARLTAVKAPPVQNLTADPLIYCVPSGADLGPTRACGWKLFDAYFNHRATPAWRDTQSWLSDKDKWYTKCSMSPQLS
jgi:hypothetical protein